MMKFYEICIDETGSILHTNRVNSQLGEVKPLWQPYGDDKRIVVYTQADSVKEACTIADNLRLDLVKSGKWCTGWVEFSKYIEKCKEA